MNLHRLRLHHFLLLFAFIHHLEARLIPAHPGNYTGFLSSLKPGDSLMLEPGIYTQDLRLLDIHGTSTQPVVIMGSPDLYQTEFQARSCCNTVSLTRCSYLVIKNLKLEGRNIAVDAVKAEGTSGNWTHDITLEYLFIDHYGVDQQIVGISTKCHSWNWRIRKNIINGAGTGLYLGDSNGDKPFVNGLIEYNLIQNTVGYNLQVKHQNVGVRDAFPGTSAGGKTIIRYNVFSKENNASTGANARPNVLVGAFPATGNGSTDHYEIYGNFFFQNPVEALFQGTGNIALYNNIFVNHFSTPAFKAINLTEHNGFKPRNIAVFHNTLWAANQPGGINLLRPDPSYSQYCISNAVFSASPISNFVQSSDNITDAYSNAANYLLSPTLSLATLDLYPKQNKLNGSETPHGLFEQYTDWDLDFNGDPYQWSDRGAYSGCCTNKGWPLQLDTMPERFIQTTAIMDFSIGKIKLSPVPARDVLTICHPANVSVINLVNIQGQILWQNTSGNVHHESNEENVTTTEIQLSGLDAGIYWLRYADNKRIYAKPFIKINHY